MAMACNPNPHLDEFRDIWLSGKSQKLHLAVKNFGAHAMCSKLNISFTRHFHRNINLFSLGLPQPYADVPTHTFQPT